MHRTSGQRDPAAAFPLPAGRDDSEERRQANRAVAVSAWVDPELIARDADALGRRAASAVYRQVPDVGSFSWSTRAAPS
jgi:hypothetical protein